MERIKKALEKARASAGAAAQLPIIGTQIPAEQTRLRPAVISHAQGETLATHRIIAGDKRDPRTAAFDLLRTQVLKEMRQKGWRTLGITSPTPDCGKTTIAINLALSIAQQTSPSILLADFDLRRPKISDYLGIQPKHDLSDYLEGRVPASAALVDPGIPRLLVLPNRRGHENATEMLIRREARELVLSLRAEDEERVLVLDLPPLLNTDDTIAFLPQVDCVLLVVADRITKKPDLEAALRLLTEANFLGTVLNKADATQLAYY